MEGWKYENMENRGLKHVMLVWKHKVWECEYGYQNKGNAIYFCSVLQVMS